MAQKLLVIMVREALMSRWRETLCGSVIKSAPEAQPGLISEGFPAMLTCGGTFRPRYEKPVLFCRQNGIIFLPKENYEVLIPGASNDWVHFNTQIAQQKEEV